GKITGSDIAKAAVAAAAHNVQSAALNGVISLETKAISQLSLSDASGLLVANPPWGVRLNDGSILDTYREIGQLARRYPQWKLCLIASDAKLVKKTGIKFTNVSPLIPMGGIRIRFYLG
ncbi:MAG: hypothetical protein JXX14_04240, partial [Deltaproteobacteria bacterium]|nr:hypothetical protein [Deltaproteobacteria bacterium]